MKIKHILGSLLFTFSIQAQTDSTKVPFENYNLRWINGQNRQKDFPLQLKDKNGETIVTGVVYLDGYFNYNFNRPKDNTQTISAVTGRANEFSIALASIGLETNYKNAIGRLWLQTGSMLHIIPFSSLVSVAWLAFFLSTNKVWSISKRRSFLEHHRYWLCFSLENFWFLRFQRVCFQLVPTRWQSPFC